MGAMQSTGSFRATYVQLSMSAQELLNTSDKSLDVFCALPPMPPQEARVVGDKCLKACDGGYTICSLQQAGTLAR